jgi:hypothetical protein
VTVAGLTRPLVTRHALGRAEAYGAAPIRNVYRYDYLYTFHIIFLR